MKNKCKAVVGLRKHGDLRNCPGGIICVNGYRLKYIVRLFIFKRKNKNVPFVGKIRVSIRQIRVELNV